MAKWLTIFSLILISIFVIAWLLSKQKPVIAPTVTPPAQSASSATSESIGTHPLIEVSSPTAGQKVSSPLSVTGKAKGNWFFEASFPIEIIDQSGEVLANGYATAKGEWMTTEFVPFEAYLEFIPPVAGTQASLVLKKDNPSGLLENDDQITIPVLF